MNFKHKSNKLNTVSSSTSPIPIKQNNFKGPRLLVILIVTVIHTKYSTSKQLGMHAADYPTIKPQSFSVTLAFYSPNTARYCISPPFTAVPSITPLIICFSPKEVILVLTWFSGV